jgi:hypothetical protein
MTIRRVILGFAIALGLVAVARGGHEQAVYPSFYPHEIEVTAIAPERAADLLRVGKLHAYVGDAPVGPAREGIGAAESLGSFVVVRLNPGLDSAADEGKACAMIGALVRDMAGRGGGFVAHPYPVTPWHGDYLHHTDRADATRQRFLSGDAAAAPTALKVRAEGALARGFVRPEWLSEGEAWDTSVEVVSAADLVGRETAVLNGWMGPRWTRSGWFQAYRLLAPSVADAGRKSKIESMAEQLQQVDYAGAAERINLERALVQSLLAGCRAAIAGYTVKREPYNATFTGGIENLSVDALEGFRSPMFLRTVKLKDFPWNGWLQLGVEPGGNAAWNPIGGFTDPFGRLMWFAVGDPAVIPSPYDAGWTLNRFSDVEAAPRR